MKLVAHEWIPRDIVGGNLALDLVNTASGWLREPEDWIPNVRVFLTWTRISGLLTGGERQEAARLAEASPAAAERVLTSLKELRFTLWHFFDAIERGRPPKHEHLSVINHWACQLTLSQQVIFRRNKMEFAVHSDISVLDLPGLRVTAPALALLMDPPAGRIKTCPANDCGWKFLDKSRNNSRRWCDMAVCGNLEKTRQFRSRNA